MAQAWPKEDALSIPSGKKHVFLFEIPAA